MRTKELAGVASVAVLLLVGCGDSADLEASEERLCTELAEYDGAVTRLASAAANGEVVQVRDLRSELEREYRDVEEAADDVRSLTIDSVTQVHNRLMQAINGVTDEATLAQAVPQINQAAGELSDARIQINDAAGC